MNNNNNKSSSKRNSFYIEGTISHPLATAFSSIGAVAVN